MYLTLGSVSTVVFVYLTVGPDEYIRFCISNFSYMITANSYVSNLGLEGDVFFWRMFFYLQLGKCREWRVLGLLRVL